MKRLVVLISLVALSSLAFAAPALAAAPSNDLYTGRIPVGSLPFLDSPDTTDATTDADDVEANVAECGAPATDASVWYELAGTDDTILVDVSTSDYSAGVIVATGSPETFSFVTCGPGAVAFFAASGETYAILAFDDQLDGGNGGTLNITIDVVPPPPEIDVTVDPVGHFNKLTGSATITGTLTCTDDADFISIQVQLTQTVGRFTITGFGFLEGGLVCDGTAQPWSVEVFGANGKFKGGRAVSVTFASGCGAFSCGEDFEERTVKLR